MELCGYFWDFSKIFSNFNGIKTLNYNFPNLKLIIKRPKLKIKIINKN